MTQETLNRNEIDIMIKRFVRAAFARVTRHVTPVANVNDLPDSDRVNAMIDSVLELANEVLSEHDATPILTRTEEDQHWGTRVHLRIACASADTTTIEQREATIRNALISHIQLKAPLLRPENVLNTLDSVEEVRVRLPTPTYASKIAWKMHRSKWSVWIPAVVSLLLMVSALGGLAFFYHQNSNRDEL